MKLTQNTGYESATEPSVSEQALDFSNHNGAATAPDTLVNHPLVCRLAQVNQTMTIDLADMRAAALELPVLVKGLL